LQGHGKRNVLIFDLGVRTLQVSIVTIEDGKCKVKVTARNTDLGGKEFDNRLFRHFAQDFNRKHKMDLTTSMPAVRRLRAACERAKCTLSDKFLATIEIDSLFQGKNIKTSIFRNEFEELNEDLFLRTTEHVKESLRYAKMDKAQIHDIVLIGGSTRIPMVQKLLQDLFNGKELKNSIKPDEIVAYGATLKAANLAGLRKSDEFQDLLWIGETP
jgi:L1 cell adhesion molecule like protein